MNDLFENIINNEQNAFLYESTLKNPMENPVWKSEIESE